jgi:hypothetical protein
MDSLPEHKATAEDKTTPKLKMLKIRRTLRAVSSESLRRCLGAASGLGVVLTSVIIILSPFLSPTISLDEGFRVQDARKYRYALDEPRTWAKDQISIE